MKSLSIEEKAKRYDEAKARMSRAYNSNRCTLGFMNEIFPELKEGEGERIKKIISDILLIDSDEIREILDANNVLMQDINGWFEKQGNKDEEILVLKDQIESLHAAIKALKETHRIEIEKQGEKTFDKIVEKARTEKQRVLLTETDGSANIDWDCRSLDDVKLLLEYGLDYIKKLENQGEQKTYDNDIKEALRTEYEKGRADAFIEKALAYLNDKFYFNNAFYGVVSTDFNAMEEMYDDFKKYMEGE